MHLITKKLFKPVFETYRNSSPFFPLIGSVLEGKQEGIVVADSPSCPQGVLVIHKFGFSQILSFGDTSIFLAKIAELLLNELKADFKLPPKVRLYAPPEKIIHTFDNNKQPHIAKCKRTQFRLNKMEDTIEFSDNSVLLSEENIQSIDRTLQLDICTRFWDNCSDAIEFSLGKLLHVNNEIACCCYAAAISNKIAEIDIATTENFRRKGYGTCVAKSFIRDCVKNNIIPNWDCYTNNEASYNLARSLGFEDSSTYTFYVIDFSMKK